MSEKQEGKAKGGHARAQALSPSKRHHIAVRAAEARWGEKPLRATHKGNFQEEFGFDVECYVLNDEQKTAVISQRGMIAALSLRTTSGGSLSRFLNGERIAPYIGLELREKTENPLRFQWAPVVSNQPQLLVHGYDATILIDICKAILRADEDGKLLPRQQNFVRQAHIVINASAKAGIKGLVYALAGYDATREETIQAFKWFVREEAREYEKEFPTQLYAEWYRLYQLPEFDETKKPWKFRHLTVSQVYTPLARSGGKILTLLREAQRATGADRRAKLHQFLSEIGVKALRTHLGQLLGIAQVSDTRQIYERHVMRVFGDQPELPFGPPHE